MLATYEIDEKGGGEKAGKKCSVSIAHVAKTLYLATLHRCIDEMPACTRSTGNDCTYPFLFCLPRVAEQA